MGTFRSLANNVRTTLSGPYTAGSGVLSVTDASGFPALSAGDWFSVSTFSTAQVPISILKVTAVDGAVLTVDSAIEGTTDVDIQAGIVALVPTAGTVTDLYAGTAYTNPDPTPASVGGIPAGSTFDAVPTTDLWDELLYPYQAPAFSAFTIVGQASPVEVGEPISGTHTFTWSTSHAGDVTADSIAIVGITSGQPNTGSYSATLAVTNSAPGSTAWTIQGTNSHGGTFSRTYSVAWQWKRYFGISANPSLSATDIQAMAGSLASGFAGTYAFPGTAFKWLCYPDSFGSPSLILDQATGFQVSMASLADDAFFANSANGFSYGLVGVTNGNGIATIYRCYRTRFPMGGALNMEVS